MLNWLRCKILPGQFSGEHGVQGEDANGEGFSLFCPEEFLEYDGEPTFDRPVEGWIQVNVVQRTKDLLLLYLPRRTFGNGPYVTVKKDAVERRPARSLAR